MWSCLFIFVIVDHQWHKYSEGPYFGDNLEPSLPKIESRANKSQSNRFVENLFEEILLIDQVEI